MRSIVQIFEALDEYYHFTHTTNLINILKNNVWRCSEDDYHQLKDYQYYISFTRSKNASTGYPTAIEEENQVRIVLDGRKLSSKFIIEPVDYFPGFKNFIPRSKQRDPKAYELYKDEWKKQTNVEAEERLYTKLQELKDPTKYIKRIELCSSNTDSTDIEEIKTLCSKLRCDLRIYNSLKEYKIGR